MRIIIVAIGCVVFLAATACERERRSFQDMSAPAARSQGPVQTPLSAAGNPPATAQSSPYQDNAWGISEGKRLFDNFNCSGCHAHGGGGMGPALMDDKWIYGSRPGTIFETIVEGRPNGMPAFRGRIPDAQVWQLVAYVQAMSGHSSLASLPGRSDHMRYGTPENARPAVQPVQTGPR